MIGEDTLIGQLAGETITSQLIDMAHDSWMKERRGPHGEWEGGGGPSASAVSHAMLRQQSQHASMVRRMRAASAARHPAPAPPAAAPASLDHAASAVAEHMTPNKATTVAARAQARIAAGGGSIPKLEDLMKTPPEKFGPKEAHQLVEAQYMQELHPQHALHLTDVLKKADQDIQRGIANFKKEYESADSDEMRRAAQKKMIIEGSIALAGIAIASVIAVVGAPVWAVIASTFGPILIQIGLERKWELAWPTT